MKKTVCHKIHARWAALLLAMALLCACAVVPAAAPAAASPAGAAAFAKGAPGGDTIPVVSTGSFELPVENSTGYTLFAQPMYRSPDKTSAVVYDAPSGLPFRVLEINREETWWKVTDESGEHTGWFPTASTMINLPDVVPSILYNDTNSYASLFKASGTVIPEITDQQLYDVYKDNPRFGTKQYVMPVLYPAAKKWYAAQQAALAAGYCLEIYELFRPYRTQRAVCSAVGALAAVDPVVNAGINTPPWGLSWFISTGTSNHQRGFACDVSIVHVLDSELVTCAGYHYTYVTEYEPVVMPTAMHELSNAAASMSTPISPLKDTWRTIGEAPGMNYYSRLLKKFCTGAGLSPLASEWWHFNDLDARTDEVVANARGDFVPNVCLSRAPSRAPALPTPTPELPPEVLEGLLPPEETPLPSPVRVPPPSDEGGDDPQENAGTGGEGEPSAAPPAGP